MPFKGGVEEAAKMLAGLDAKAQERILEDIAKRDPQMAEALRDGLITMEDLQFLTVKMLQELLQEINIPDLGLALRICSMELRNFITENVSKNTKDEINEFLAGKPQSLDKVSEATERIMQIVKEKLVKGQLVINKNSNDEYV